MTLDLHLKSRGSSQLDSEANQPRNTVPSKYIMQVEKHWSGSVCRLLRADERVLRPCWDDWREMAKFVKQYLGVIAILAESAKAYADDVRSDHFPGAEHPFQARQAVTSSAATSSRKWLRIRSASARSPVKIRKASAA